MARGGGRAGKSGGRSREPPTRDVMVSKKLAWLLRHGAEKEGLKLGKGGYANVQHVLQNRNIKSLQPAPSFREIVDLVQANAKQRFSLIHISAGPQEASSPEAETGLPDQPSAPQDLDSMLRTDEDPANYLIRANQGHSMQLDSGVEDLLVPITVEANNVPQLVVHGTRKEHWPKIVASGGLKPMSRNHVHFATGLPASFTSKFAADRLSTNHASASNEVTSEVVELPEKKHAPLVISGMRETSTILMFLDIHKAIKNGLSFYLSENGVVLSGGNEQGLIPLELFDRVEDRNGTALIQDGKAADSK